MIFSQQLSRPTVTLINELNRPFIFVIPPTGLVTDRSQNIKIKNIIDKGEMTNNKGTKNLSRISFSGFFPSISSNFYSFLNPMPPITCVEYLNKSMTDNEKFKLIVPQWSKFLRCRIENFTDIYNDHTGDIYYEITLIEERSEYDNNIDELTGLLKRA